MSSWPVVAAVVGMALAAACCSPATTGTPSRETAQPEVDEHVDLQAMIQAAAQGSGDVYLAARTYVIPPVPHAFWCLDVPSGVRIHGAGPGKTVLQEAGGAGPSVRLLRVSGDNVLIENLTLDGNKAAQTPNKQRHGIFAQDGRGLVVRNVTSQNFTGDGFYLYNHVKDAKFIGVVATGNNRNGLTLGAIVDGTTLQDSRFVGNGVQQVDSEPGGTAVVSNTTVSHCLLDGAGVSNDFVLTVSGTPQAQGTGWNVANNQINGGVFVVWAQKVLIANNTGVNPTTKPSVTVYRTSSDVSIVGNHFEMTQSRRRSIAGILVQGTGTGSAPARVIISHNDIKMGYEQSFGVRAEGAIDVSILDNTLRGPGRSAPPFAGIYLRATNPKEDFRSAIVRGNTIRDFGERGISVHGNGDARLLSVEISDNTFDNDTTVPAMTKAISLDDGTGAAGDVTVRGNRLMRGVTVPLVNVPQRARVTSDLPVHPER